MAANYKPPKIKPTTIKAEIKMPTMKQIKESGADPKVVKNAFVVGSLRASGVVERELPQRLTEAMESSVWGPFSPKQPYYRKNGELVGPGSRDLIDTGALHDSLKIKTSFLSTKTVISVSYTSPYAGIVHYGGVIQPWGNPNAASVILPARPWVQSVLGGGGPVPQYNVNQVFQDNITAAFNS